MTHYAVQCDNLSKAYQHHLAIDEVSFTVSKGEILALVGPSGCGKTTTLRLIAGFEQAERGTIRLGDQLVSNGRVHVPPEKRGIGMVFQEAALFPHLTVLENVTFGLSNQQVKTRKARGCETLEMVGMAQLTNRYPHELSGGERQRVALARALCPRPELVLLDEPFSNLDADLRQKLRAEVRGILKEMQASAIFVTHDQEEALFIGDRLAVMRAGRIEQIGAPEEVYGQPATRFVAEFMGDAQFISGRVTEAGVQSELGLIPQATGLPYGTPVDLAVRADDLTFVPDPDASAVIEDRVYAGMLTVYKLRLPSGLVLQSLQPHTSRHPRGTAVRIIVDPGHALACFPSQ
jgi:iron(III) transport system ATP-binding protein